MQSINTMTKMAEFDTIDSDDYKYVTCTTGEGYSSYSDSVEYGSYFKEGEKVIFKTSTCRINTNENGDSSTGDPFASKLDDKTGYCHYISEFKPNFISKTGVLKWFKKRKQEPKINGIPALSKALKIAMARYKCDPNYLYENEWLLLYFNREDFESQKEIKDKLNDSQKMTEKYGCCKYTLGFGSYGVVRLSQKRVKEHNELYAIKEFKFDTRKCSYTRYINNVTKEFCLSNLLKHENIVNVYDIYQDEKSGLFYQTLEYCSGGDLFSYVEKRGKLKKGEADCFFKQILEAVKYFHDLGFAHCDLKPENILVAKEGVIKISDFGGAEVAEFNNSKKLSSGIKGSKPYIAPEQYTYNEYDPMKADIWACGLIYIGMVTGKSLWKSATMSDFRFRIYLRALRGYANEDGSTGYLPIEELKKGDRESARILYGLLNPNPRDRINLGTVLQSTWLQTTRSPRKNVVGS